MVSPFVFPASEILLDGEWGDTFSSGPPGLVFFGTKVSEALDSSHHLMIGSLNGSKVKSSLTETRAR